MKSQPSNKQIEISKMINSLADLYKEINLQQRKDKQKEFLILLKRLK